jgi:hypothetical protein
MKRVSEPKKVTRAPVPAGREDRVRVVRVNGPAGRAVRWHVSRPSPKK